MPSKKRASEGLSKLDPTAQAQHDLTLMLRYRALVEAIPIWIGANQLFNRPPHEIERIEDERERAERTRAITKAIRKKRRDAIFGPWSNLDSFIRSSSTSLEAIEARYGSGPANRVGGDLVHDHILDPGSRLLRPLACTVCCTDHRAEGLRCADEIIERLRLAEARQASMPPEALPLDTRGPTHGKGRPSREATALGILADEPGISATELAARMGVKRQTLYTWQKMRGALRVRKEAAEQKKRSRFGQADEDV